MTADTSITAEGKNITFQLSASLNLKDKTYSMPVLSFILNHGMIKEEKYISIWDNELYLIESLYKKVLVPWCDEKSIIETSFFTELIDVEGVVMEDFKVLKKLIEQGIELKFW